MSVVLSVAQQQALVVQPREATVTDGGRKDFGAFDCPLNAAGEPDVGEDGVPGTDDDLCEPITVDEWSVSGSIGTLTPASGATTTLTADLPPGSAQERGQVIATEGERRAAVAVTVDAPRRRPSATRRRRPRRRRPARPPRRRFRRPRASARTSTPSSRAPPSG
ncbi:MAG: hypothetical protein ACRDPR_13295 [Nocardioidaceae bacterium]